MRHVIKKYLSQFSKSDFCFCFYIDSQSFRRNYNLSEGYRSLMLSIMINMAIPGNHMLLITCISVIVGVCSFIQTTIPIQMPSLNISKANRDFRDHMGQQGARNTAEQSISFHIAWRLYYAPYKCRKTCLPGPSLVQLLRRRKKKKKKETLFLSCF